MKTYWVTMWKSNGFYNVKETKMIEASSEREAYEKRGCLGIDYCTMVQSYTMGHYLKNQFGTMTARIERIDESGKVIYQAHYC